MRTNFAGSRVIPRIVALATGLSLSFVDRLHGSAAGIGDDQNTTQASGRVEKGSARRDVCERDADKLLSEKRVRIDRSVRAPKKIHDVRPKYPELPPGTVGSGVWLGEILINDSGRIASVWPIREVEFKPPLPEFNDAIRNAIRQWQFEPLLLHGTPVSVCVTVTVNINWK